MLGFESPRPPKIHPNQVQNVRRCVMNDLKTCIAAAVSGRSAEVSIFSRDCALSGGMRGAGGGEGGVDKSTPGGLRGLRIKDHVQHAAEGAADLNAARILPGRFS